MQRGSVLSDRTRNAADIIGIRAASGAERNDQIERIKLEFEEICDE